MKQRRHRLVGRVPPTIVVALLAGGAFAQEAPDTQNEPTPLGETVEVYGLSADDMLNLRATASPGGMLVARIANGTVLTNHGCVDVTGNQWCKVSQVDNASIMGWAAARYLLPSEGEPLPAE